jgi:hypothetical protein
VRKMGLRAARGESGGARRRTRRRRPGRKPKRR